MCLTCGCMDAHAKMGDSNITYEDLKKAADENGRSVDETFVIVERTKAKDHDEHPGEYRAGTAAWDSLQACRRGAPARAPVSRTRGPRPPR